MKQIGGGPDHPDSSLGTPGRPRVHRRPLDCTPRYSICKSAVLIRSVVNNWVCTGFWMVNTVSYQRSREKSGGDHNVRSRSAVVPGPSAMFSTLWCRRQHGRLLTKLRRMDERNCRNTMAQHCINASNFLWPGPGGFDIVRQPLGGYWNSGLLRTGIDVW